MESELEVFLDVEGECRPVGRLWARVRGARESASFEYHPDWLSFPGAFGLEPQLPLSRGQFHTERPLFNAFSDPAPDRWGQTLLRRNERARAARENRQPRTLLAVDFLMLVEDETRLGALRFRRRGEKEFLSKGDRPVPPLVELGKLLSATQRIVADRESDEDLRLLLAPGTSLGGARPKASVRDRDGALSIAKFPSKDDDWPITTWEFVALDLASHAGISLPNHRLAHVLKRDVLLLRRFDREKGARVPFVSGLTALAASDGEAHTYRELASFIRQQGEKVNEQLDELFRRMVFNILVSNTDDHLRNHGFLWAGRGWQLSPAYDLNPMPADVRPRNARALTLDSMGENTLEDAIGLAPRFGLTEAAARRISKQVGEAVNGWRKVAKRAGLSPRQIERMKSAFEHDDLRTALGKR